MYGACLAYIRAGDRPADVSPRDTTGVLHRTFTGNVNSQVNSHTMFITLQALNNFYAAPCGRSRGGGRGNFAMQESFMLFLLYSLYLK